uniref:Uncharacterized protein n=1 Tax=Rhizophora mucronata TaxID=61149 RepID=A0A2P2JGM8_RHIMU
MHPRLWGIFASRCRDHFTILFLIHYLFPTHLLGISLFHPEKCNGVEHAFHTRITGGSACKHYTS